jgi:large subunit ribosomal protein L3
MAAIPLPGRKIGMTQIFEQETGKVTPVTVVQLGPCFVTQIKTAADHGYSALQLGFEEEKKKHRITKPMAGHFKNSGVKPTRHLQEARVKDGKDLEGYKLGDEIKCTIFEVGQKIDVIGLMKGRGFTGWMKRWGFHGKNATHGVHESHRMRGALGGHSMPGRTFPGMKMAGRYGHERITIRNLKIVEIQAERNIVLIKGAIPGANGGLVTIRPTNVKRRKAKYQK